MNPTSFDSFDLHLASNMSVREKYSMLISTVIPRPIALVSTLGIDGSENLAPFSFFNGVSSNPPCLSISIARKSDGSRKDTLRNIQETKEFVVNIMPRERIDEVAICGAEFPYSHSEIEEVGFSRIKSEKVKPHRIKESPIHFECTLYSHLDIGDGSAGSTTLIIGEILAWHIASAVKDDSGRIDSRLVNPLSRLGGIGYGSLGEFFQRKIPEV